MGLRSDILDYQKALYELPDRFFNGQEIILFWYPNADEDSPKISDLSITNRSLNNSSPCIFVSGCKLTWYLAEPYSDVNYTFVAKLELYKSSA